MSVGVLSNYSNLSISPQVSFIKIRYIVSCHPFVDIQYAQLNFNVTRKIVCYLVH
jgi:hypothetical protein